MGKIFEKAVNPSQYDLNDVNWEKETINSHYRRYYLEYIIKHKTLWQGAEVLEIGSGLGWLLDIIKKNGAKNVEGIEPSKKNFEISNKLYPYIKVFNDSFEDFSTNNIYDFIISIMAFNHFRNLDKSFEKISSLLKKNGKVIMIVPDYDYFKLKRYDYNFEIEEINNDGYAVQVEREEGILADVVRKVSVYEKSALNYGLKLISNIPLYATEELLNKIPKYKEFKDVCRENLLIFEKTI